MQGCGKGFGKDKIYLQLMKRVKSNGGAPGIDGMTVQELHPYLKEQWLEIRAALESGAYRPSPVRRVEIAKPEGGVRQLGIPNVMDRFLQQAISQVMVPLFEALFSEHSYGFRPGRSAHGAVRQAQTYVQAWLYQRSMKRGCTVKDENGMLNVQQTEFRSTLTICSRISSTNVNRLPVSTVNCSGS